MIVDGKKIAEELKRELRGRLSKRSEGVTLGIVIMAPDFATEKFVAVKRRVASEIGVTLLEERLPNDAATEDVIETVENLSRMTNGLIVQLPLGPQVDVQKVIAAIPPSRDVDGLTEGAIAAAPVVAAMQEILARESIALAGKKAVVVGAGRLVGLPAAAWLKREGADVEVVTSADTAIEEAIKQADILVLGAGSPGLIQPHMLKEGVAVLDAGTSEAAGKLAGDADPSCADKASLFTPVPGGIGPVAVVMIFKNLLDLADSSA